MTTIQHRQKEQALDRHKGGVTGFKRKEAVTCWTYRGTVIRKNYVREKTKKTERRQQGEERKSARHDRCFIGKGERGE